MNFVMLLMMKNEKMTNDHVTKCSIKSDKNNRAKIFNTFPCNNEPTNE